MKIKNLGFGGDNPCRIIAELGTLHLSSYENLMEATKDAFLAGADAVKVQLINPVSAWWASKEQVQRYRSQEAKGWGLYSQNWSDYFSECQAVFDGPVFASVFDERFIGFLDGDMPAWKIGWKVNNMPGLIQAIFDTGKPVIWSLNGSEYWRQGLLAETDGEVRESTNSRAIENLSHSAFRLYVQTIYPTPLEKRIMPDFESGLYHGVSYHSTGLNFLYGAIMAGAKCLEVHVEGEKADGPDIRFALSLDELKRLVDCKNKIEALKAL